MHFANSNKSIGVREALAAGDGINFPTMHTFGSLWPRSSRRPPPRITRDMLQTNQSISVGLAFEETAPRWLPRLPAPRIEVRPGYLIYDVVGEFCASLRAVCYTRIDEDTQTTCARAQT
jgi:hypothetical protein